MLQHKKSNRLSPKNRQVLITASHGIDFRYRQILMDIMQLIPHGRLESRLGYHNNRKAINDLADCMGCSNIIFFQVLKHKDPYLWISESPEGPSVKLYVKNACSMQKLKLRGDHIKGSRPVLSFQKAFSIYPELSILMELIKKVFAPPRAHRNVKPYFDHVLSFSLVEHQILIRNYQVISPSAPNKRIVKKLCLNEVGPRLCLGMLKIFTGSFAGSIIYANPRYIPAHHSRQKSLKSRKKLIHIV